MKRITTKILFEHNNYLGYQINRRNKRIEYFKYKNLVFEVYQVKGKKLTRKQTNKSNLERIMLIKDNNSFLKSFV